MVVFRVTRPLYDILFLLAVPFLLPSHYLRRPEALRSLWIKERFGRIRTEDGPIWVHAVSVGEAMASRPLLSRLIQTHRVMVTTVTDTGRKVMNAYLKGRGDLFYAPLDLSFVIRGLLRRIRPRAILVMETELWPNLFYYAHREGIPLVVVNGRISSRSFRRYRRIKWFMKGMLRCGRLYCMQTERDRERLLELGAPADRVIVTGNLKLDVSPPSDPPHWMDKLGHPVVVAGSTHRGEEEVILSAFSRVKEEHPSATLIMAPRHPERFSEVEEIIQKAGVSYCRRSQEVRDVDVVLLDTMGELQSVYGGADVCIIGGSFVPKGGHNLFEAACWGKPILTGPFMDNFPLAEDFFNQGAAIKTGPDNLREALMELLKDREPARQMGRRAMDLYRGYQGAVEQTYSQIMKILQEVEG